jgi:hypothetical protein
VTLAAGSVLVAVAGCASTKPGPNLNDGGSPFPNTGSCSVTTTETNGASTTEPCNGG